MRLPALVLGALALGMPNHAIAQDEGAGAESAPAEHRGRDVRNVFDGDYVTVGLGVGYGPSYDGSDDYRVSPAPILQGRVQGIDFSPRAAGLALDFIPDNNQAVAFDLGVVGRVRRDRASQIKDPVVKQLGKLDTAIEVGPTGGVSFSGLLNPYDSITFGTDIRWDVAGAHSGMVIDPAVTYFTPIGRGMALSLSLGAEHVDDAYADYYFSVSEEDSDVSGLPVYDAKGGFTKGGINALFAVDLNGNVQDGGFSLVLIGGYSRMLGDAKRSPFTAIRGSENQFFGAVGVGYTF